MALYRCHVKNNLSRAKGQSTLASAAYMARDKLHDERIGQTFDFSRNADKAEWCGIFTPTDAPEWARDRQALWSAVEASEKRKDSQLARPLELALLHELSLEQNRWLLQDFIKENFTRKGYVTDAAIHSASRDGDERNIHAHLLVTLRTIDENGFSKSKKQEQENYRNKSEYTEELRKRWAEHGARHLARAGFELEAERFREAWKTLEEQRAAALERGDLAHAEALDREATTHRGPHVDAMERRGVQTDRGDENRAIEARNEERAALRKAAREIERREREPEPQPMRPEDHAEAVQSRGDDAAARWLAKMNRRADIREGFEAAKDETTKRADKYLSEDRQGGGHDAPRTTAEITAERIRTSQDPVRNLRRWLDEDGPRRGGSDLLPSRPFASLAGIEGLRPLRDEANDPSPAPVRDTPQDAPEAHRDAPERSPFAALPATALERTTEARKDAEKGREDRAARIRKLFEEAERRKAEREAEKAKGKHKPRSRDY